MCFILSLSTVVCLSLFLLVDAKQCSMVINSSETYQQMNSSLAFNSSMKYLHWLTISVSICHRSLEMNLKLSSLRTKYNKIKCFFFLVLETLTPITSPQATTTMTSNFRHCLPPGDHKIPEPKIYVQSWRISRTLNNKYPLQSLSFLRWVMRKYFRHQIKIKKMKHLWLILLGGVHNA